METASRLEQRSRALGSFYGLLVGDALGAPYEFRSRHTYETSTDYVKCKTFPGVNIPLGGWTDDSSMALCLLESFLENNGRWNAADCVQRWMRWVHEGDRPRFQLMCSSDGGHVLLGYMSSADVCFDIGTLAVPCS
jgi:ADP-ribosylglycohydrolase